MLDYTEGHTALDFGSTTIAAAAPIKQAMFCDVRDAVVVLTQKDDAGTAWLQVFDRRGAELARFEEPKGYRFYYLTSYRPQGIAVVCIIDDETYAANTSDWCQDWHFHVDLEAQRLRRGAPAR